MSALGALHDMGLSGAAPMVVSVNGLPLNTVLQQIVSAMQEQSATVAQLQQYTYDTHGQMWARISALEASVTRLDNDVGVTQRPLPHLHPAPTLFTAVNILEQRISRLNSLRECGAAVELRRRLAATFRTNAFIHWKNIVRVRRAVGQSLQSTQVTLLSRYFALWTSYRRSCTAWRAQRRKLRSLAYYSSKEHLRQSLQTWRAVAQKRVAIRDSVRDAKHRASTSMRAVSLRGHARSAFGRWRDWLTMLKGRSAIQHASDVMRTVSLRAIAARFFSKWKVVETRNAMRRRKRRVADALRVSTARYMMHRVLRGWINTQLRTRRRLASSGIIPRLCAIARSRLAHSYYGKLARHVVVQKDQRAVLERDVMFADLAHRCDSLGTQLDVALRAMSNTNTVVAKVVERLVAVEASGSVGNSSLRGGSNNRGNAVYTTPREAGSDDPDAGPISLAGDQSSHRPVPPPRRSTLEALAEPTE